MHGGTVSCPPVPTLVPGMPFRAPDSVSMRTTQGALGRDYRRRREAATSWKEEERRQALQGRVRCRAVWDLPSHLLLNCRPSARQARCALRAVLDGTPHPAAQLWSSRDQQDDHDRRMMTQICDLRIGPTSIIVVIWCVLSTGTTLSALRRRETTPPAASGSESGHGSPFNLNISRIPPRLPVPTGDRGQCPDSNFY